LERFLSPISDLEAVTYSDATLYCPISVLVVSVIDFELVFECNDRRRSLLSPLEAVSAGDGGVDVGGMEEGSIDGTSASDAAFGLLDLSELKEEDFGSIVSSSDDLSKVLCLCINVAGEFGRLEVFRAEEVSSDVREIFVRFEDSLGARLRVGISDAPVSRRPLGLAVVW
jgi:hypothetical protein